MTRKVVYRIEDGVDRQGVLATTYQMRNFYRQMGDGFFSVLDVMNYIQHHQVTKWCQAGNHVLDVCCGRGLMLPLLRYHRKDIASYTGVDISEKNATFVNKRVTDGKPVRVEEYYPFPIRFVCSNVAEMANKLDRQYDVIIYTSSIEHMHKDAGQKSLHECYAVSKPGTVLVLTCPNTPEDQDGYDTQYRAHVYEWKRSELIDGLALVGFEIICEYGILVGKRDLKQAMEPLGLLSLLERLEKFVPAEWLIPVLSPMFPKESKEIGIVAKAV